MQYQVFVQSHSDTRFIASVIGLPGCAAEGSTKEEAIGNAKRVLQQQLQTGEFVTIHFDWPSDGKTDPWIQHMGFFANDPTFDDFLAEVAAYRQQVVDSS